MPLKGVADSCEKNSQHPVFLRESAVVLQNTAVLFFSYLRLKSGISIFYKEFTLYNLSRRKK